MNGSGRNFNHWPSSFQIRHFKLVLELSHFIRLLAQNNFTREEFHPPLLKIAICIGHSTPVLMGNKKNPFPNLAKQSTREVLPTPKTLPNLIQSNKYPETNFSSKRTKGNIIHQWQREGEIYTRPRTHFALYCSLQEWTKLRRYNQWLPLLWNYPSINHDVPLARKYVGHAYSRMCTKR